MSTYDIWWLLWWSALYLQWLFQWKEEYKKFWLEWIKNSSIDVWTDAMAAMIPFVPAWASKAAKIAEKWVSKIDNIFENESRVQHAYRHLQDDFWNWNKQNRQKFENFVDEIIKNPDDIIKTIEKQWNEKITRYSKKIGDYIYNADIFNTWKFKWNIRTVTKTKIDK